MRYCYYCKKPMHTSNCSIWIKEKNYPAHNKCIMEKPNKELPKKWNKKKEGLDFDDKKYEKDAEKERKE